jgi:hypothetical protein
MRVGNDRSTNFEDRTNKLLATFLEKLFNQPDPMIHNDYEFEPSKEHQKFRNIYDEFLVKRGRNPLQKR